MSDAPVAAAESSLPHELAARTLALLARGGRLGLTTLAFAAVWTIFAGTALGLATWAMMALGLLSSSWSAGGLYAVAFGATVALGFASLHLGPISAFALALNGSPTIEDAMRHGADRWRPLIAPAFGILAGGVSLVITLTFTIGALKDTLELWALAALVALAAASAWVYGRGLASAARVVLQPRPPRPAIVPWLLEPLVGAITPLAIVAIAAPSFTRDASLGAYARALTPVAWGGGVFVLALSILLSCAVAVALVSRGERVE